MNASFDEKINKIPFHLSSLIHTFLCALSLFMKVKFLYYNDKEIYKQMTKILYFTFTQKLVSNPPGSACSSS